MVARGERGLREPTADRRPALTGPPSNGGRPKTGGPRPERSVIRQGDRLKAYRPIPPERRREALEAGIEAYEQGDFFEAHELLEPAWMGTAVLAERALYQGLIKLAAGYVHCVRGNPTGMARNLEGARRLLATSLELDTAVAQSVRIDLLRLLSEVDARLAAARSATEAVDAGPTAVLDLVESAPKIR